MFHVFLPNIHREQDIDTSTLGRRVLFRNDMGHDNKSHIGHGDNSNNGDVLQQGSREKTSLTQKQQLLTIAIMYFS